MLNDFLSLAKTSLAEQLPGKVDLDAGQIDGVTDIVTDAFKSNITEKVKSGGIGDIMSLIGGQGSKSPFANNIVSSVVSGLVSKLGLSSGIADTIAKFAVPFIIDKFAGFAKDNGKDNKAGISDLLGDVMTDSLKDNLLGGLGKKFGF